MRDLPTISTLWGTSNGNFVGDNKPHGRVTVEPSWSLQLTGQQYGASDLGPYRYYFDATEAQYPNANEVEVPNIKSIEIKRSVDQDAADCVIEVYNQWMDDNGVAGDSPDVLGNPGYLGPTYGTHSASGLFGQTTNTWEDILIPNAMLRTYQGYGGYTAGVPDALATAVANGNLAITGIWLIDSVTTGTTGMLRLQCRDMAKLLVDQMLIEPLTPSHFSPMKYCRWVAEPVEATVEEAGGGNEPGADPTPAPEPASFRPTYQDSSMERWCISNPLYGHYFEAAADGDASTSSWSQGVYSPNAIFARAFWQFDVGAQINQIRVNACRNSFGTLWISVREGGRWQGEARIPWDDGNGDGYSDSLAASQPGSQPCRPMNVDIRYVRATTIGNLPEWIDLPRTYDAQRIRLTTNQSWNSGIGPFPYRACLQEVRCRLTIEGSVDESTDPGDQTNPPDEAALDEQFGNPFEIYIVDGGIEIEQTEGAEREFVPGTFDADGLFTPDITPGPTTVWHDGNVMDWVEIVRDMLMWSGFTFYGGPSPSDTAGVHGLLQFSGTWPEECINEEFFSKKPVMQAINEIKDVLGYVFWVDEEGAVRFHMPNWYYPGNVLGDGSRTSTVYELFDELTITEYQSQLDDTTLASEIIVGSSFPPQSPASDDEESATGATQNYTTYNPNTLEGPTSGDLFNLRGMTRPIIWVNEIWERPSEQRLSAALLGVHALFGARKGNVTILANPELQLGDQVRITERTAAESYIHMIRSIDSRMDLDTGEYLMSLTTNWLGEAGDWVIDSEFLLNELGGVFDLTNIDLGQELAYGDPNLPPGTEPDIGDSGAGD